MGKLLGLLFVVILLSSAGCKKPMKEPEQLDPIYNDLVSQLAETQGYLTAEQAELANAIKKWGEVKPQSGEEGKRRRAVFQFENQVRKFEQQVKYLELRIESRVKWARKSYLEAWKKEEPWPNTALQAKYDTHRRLKTASKKWGDRVPKLNERLLLYKSKMAPEE